MFENIDVHILLTTIKWNVNVNNVSIFKEFKRFLDYIVSINLYIFDKYIRKVNILLIVNNKRPNDRVDFLKNANVFYLNTIER